MNWLDYLALHPTWKKYSQSGEESIIADIFFQMPEVNMTIVEFGAWDGKHLSNTLYFEEAIHYKRILFDGDNRGNKEVIERFITAENATEILKEQNCPKEFDLFCIDLDGNDYYILSKVLDDYKPMLIVAEFNPIFDKHEAKSIAYNPKHTWNEDDYYGFSFKAGLILAEKYGYVCVHQNDNLNMYFIEKNKLAESLKVDVSEVHNHIPKVDYQVTHYHPKSNRTEWVDID